MIRRGLFLILFAAALYLLWQVLTVLLLAFLAGVFAVTLNWAAKRVSDHTPLSRAWAMWLIVLIIVGLGAACVLLMGPSVNQQVDRLAEELPKAVQHAQDWLGERGWGAWLLERAENSMENSSGGQSSMLSRMRLAASTIIGAVTDVVMLIALALFAAASPGLYVSGVVMLTPKPHEDKAREVMTKLAAVLHWWVIGRMGSMLIVGFFTGLGLALLGLPVPWLLGLLAGLLSFVPNIGPIVSALPGLLLAATLGFSYVLIALAIYAGVQAVESLILTPMIDRYTVSIPPALLLVVQLMMGVLTGIWGLIVAAPLLVTILVLIKLLYVRDTLGRNVEISTPSTR